MFCTNCGRECREGKFCPECGTQLEDCQSQGSVMPPAEEQFPEPGTEAFEARKAMLNRRRIPHCPECLCTHVQGLPYLKTAQYYTRFLCLWCGYEWHPRRTKKFKEPIWL